MHAADDIRGWLIDLDGTLVCGGRAVPGAHAFLDACAGRFVVEGHVVGRGGSGRLPIRVEVLVEGE